MLHKFNQAFMKVGKRKYMNKWAIQNTYEDIRIEHTETKTQNKPFITELKLG